MDNDKNENPAFYAIIPANVRYAKIPQGAKLLYGEITALAHANGYSWASDKYFADLYDVSKMTVQRWLRALEKGGFVTREVKYKKGTNQIDKRFIKLGSTNKKEATNPDKDSHVPSNKSVTTYPQKCGYPTNKNVSTPSNKNVRENITRTFTNTFTNTSNKTVSDVLSLTDRFNSLWSLYPNKKGKEPARKAYERAIKSGVTDDVIKSGIAKQVAEMNAKHIKKQFIRHGSTWFNQRGWEDDYDLTPESPQATSAKRASPVRETLPDYVQPGYKPPKRTVTPEQQAELKARLAELNIDGGAWSNEQNSNS